MAMRNPVGRANYQPNSFGEGPRESTDRGFRSFPASEEGQKVRLRPESFADHYSQARQFYISQSAGEQAHIVNALTFELSKVDTPAIRERMVAHLLNIEQELAKAVADNLGIKKIPKAADAAVPTRDDLAASPSLSILENGPDSFAGRKVGVLVSDGADASVLNALKSALTKEGAVLEIIAAKISGAVASDGGWIDANHSIDGAPSVLFDAVALLVTEEAAGQLANQAGVREFVADAFVHCKFIAFTQSAAAILAKAGVEDDHDEGMINLDGQKGIKSFVESCRHLRLWKREGETKF